MVSNHLPGEAERMFLLHELWKLILGFLEADAVFGAHGRTVL
jgi:hypothetical protein